MAEYNRKAVRGWMLYDWASQPFHTLLVTFFFAPYFVAHVAADPVSGQSAWGWMTGLAGIALAVIAPISGAVADNIGPRKPWIAVFSLVFVIAATLLWYAEPGMENTLGILAAFALCIIAVELTYVFTNAYLPEIVPHAQIGRISANGWAAGYAGGLASVLFVLAFVAELGGGTTYLGFAPAFGLLDGAAFEGTRALGIIAAVWYIVFVIPFFLWVPDAARRKIGTSLGTAIHELKTTLGKLPERPSLLAFLASSMFYRDALVGLYTFGGIYAGSVLGWGLAQLGVFAILGLVFGIIGVVLGGRIDEALGPKPVVLCSIIALTITCFLAIATTRDAFLGMGLGEGSSLPDILFYIYGALMGAFGGTLQASSRTLMVHQVEDKTRMTEAFGLYALSGKATAFVAPISVALATQLTGSQQLGIVPVIVLFIIGLMLLARVRT